MPRWVVRCPSCQQDFTHSQIPRRELQDYYFDKKPEFPMGGTSLHCPNCRTVSIVKRHQLTYRDGG